jgi:hypothetical protein
MRLKKLVLILIGCFALTSCATFDPKRHFDGYQSFNQLPVSNKYNSKVYILHQPVETLAHPMVGILYADGKYVGRTFPGLMLLHETNNSKVNLMCIQIHGVLMTTTKYTVQEKLVWI